MENGDKIVLEAEGEFPFQFFIEKAVATEDADEMILEGVASTTNVDHDNERMSSEALRAMESAINDGGVPLRVEHSKEASAIIGTVYEARVDERNQLHVKARLDKTHAVSSLLYRSMKDGAKMGLSVGGVVKRATKEFVESVGKVVKTFYDVALQEVSVTPRPANYDSWLVAKSITEKQNDGDRFRDTGFYNDFLFDNPKLDYLQAFAKSIPDEAWHKVSKTNSENMETKTKGEETTDTEKAVSRVEFNTFASSMTKAIEAIAGSLHKMSDSASDQDDPKEKKPKEVGDKPAKKSETETETKEKSETETETKEKSETETETKEKSETETETKEKSETETETKEKSETESEKEKADSDEYDIQTVERSIKSIERLASRIKKTSEKETETKEKSETETEEEKEKAEESETTKGIQPIDRLAMAVSKTLAAMNDKMEKSGKTVLGFEKSIVDTLVEDPEFQKSVKEMMSVPGRKASVSMGVPYVTTKEGKRYALTLNDVGAPTIQKSQDAKGKSFKDVYKSEFSSVREAE
jgi:phage head maturation protease